MHRPLSWNQRCYQRDYARQLGVRAPGYALPAGDLAGFQRVCGSIELSITFPL